MDKAIMFGMLAFAATLLVAGGSIYAEGTGDAKGFGQENGFECPMHEAMENAGYNITNMEQMHKAMHGNGTECPMHEAMEKNGLNFTDMEEMHEAMHGNPAEGCQMLQGNGIGMMGGSGMMGMMQRNR